MKNPRSLEDKLLVAWNAAYWMMRSEARRQRKARFPDCDWRLVESDDDWAGAVATAQAEACLAAMQGWVPGGSRFEPMPPWMPAAS
jgi:hypothetical protein